MTKHLDQIIEIARAIEAQSDEPLTLQQFAMRWGLSVGQIHRGFAQALGVSPKQFHAFVRRKNFRDLLRGGEDVTGATYEAGYGSSSRVVDRQGAQLGMPPTAYARGGEGARISWCIGQTDFGLLLMAATPRGVCRVQFGETVSELLDGLRGEYPRSNFVAAQQSDQLEVWFECLRDYLAAKAPRPEVPLDLVGTAFQTLVWQFLLSIPEGETRTYSFVASQIGRPTATRAVANACGQNPVAILVPCHRILRADGGLGGYRWGEGVKRHLLEQEKLQHLRG